jgi:hypothetical protein
MKQINSSNYFKHLEQVASRPRKSKPVNQQVVNLPQGTTIDDFEAVDYLHGRSTPKCPMKLTEFPYLYYYGKSGGYHQFLWPEKEKVIIAKKIKKNETRT